LGTYSNIHVVDDYSYFSLWYYNKEMLFFAYDMGLRSYINGSQKNHMKCNLNSAILYFRNELDCYMHCYYWSVVVRLVLTNNDMHHNVCVCVFVSMLYRVIEVMVSSYSYAS